MNCYRGQLVQVLAILLVIATPPFTGAAKSIYMKADQIWGEYRERPHEDWCLVHSYDFDLNYLSEGGIHPSGRMTLGPFQITKPIDRASVQLADKMGNGRAIEYLWVEVEKPTSQGKFTYLGYAFSDVIITHIDWEDSIDTEFSLETLTFTCSAYLVRYSYRREDGRIDPPQDTGWNQVTDSNSPLPPPPPNVGLITSGPMEVPLDYLSISASPDPDVAPDPLLVEDGKLERLPAEM